MIMKSATKKEHYIPLIKRMYGIFFIATLLPLIVLIASGLINIFTLQQHQTEILQEEIADNTVNRIDSYLKQIEAEMTLTVSKMTNMEDIVNSRHLNALMAFDQGFETLILMDRKGYEIEKVSRYTLFTKSDLKNRSETPEFIKTIEESHYLGPVSISQFKEPIVTMAIKIRDIRQNFIGVLTAEINLKYMWDIISLINTGNEGYAYIIDNKGQLIAHNDSSQVLREQNLSSLEGVMHALNSQTNTSWYTGMEGIEVIGSYKPLKKANWFIVVESPRHEALSIVYRTVFINIFLLIITIGLTILLITHMARRFIHPIKELQKGAAIFGEGDLSHQIEISSKDEIGDLTEVFNQMAVKLSNTQHEMQQQLIELKKTGESLHESQDKFSKAFYSSSDSISITSAKTGSFIEMNRGFEKIFGYTRKEMFDKTVHELGLWKYTEDRERMVKILTKEGSIQNYTAIGINKSGQNFFGSISAEIININDEICLLTTVRDITEQKKSEESLQRSERNYREIFNSTSDAIFIHHAETGAVIDVNSSMLKMYGYEKGTVIGLGIEAFSSEIKPYTGKLAGKKIEKVIKDGPQVFEWQAMKKNGELFWVEVNLKFSEISGQKRILAVVRNITETKKSREALVQSEKMLSVGGLAAGMAHEINNPLAGMIQTAAVLSKRLTGDLPANDKAAVEAGITMDDIHTFMDARGVSGMLINIQEAGARAADIVKNMLSFAIKDNNSISSHDITKLMDKSIQLAEIDYRLKKDFDFRQIEIIREYEDNIPLVTCEAGKIQQVIMNILKNGAEAMYDAKDRNTKAQFILRISFEKKDNMVRMEIEDNGPGMSEKVRKRIFEPFYTTKPTTQGTGLGLSISYFIITENHKGDISIESQPGSGTKFVIRLPLGNDSEKGVQ